MSTEISCVRVINKETNEISLYCLYLSHCVKFMAEDKVLLHPNGEYFQGGAVPSHPVRGVVINLYPFFCIK